MFSYIVAQLKKIMVVAVLGLFAISIFIYYYLTLPMPLPKEGYSYTLPAGSSFSKLAYHLNQQGYLPLPKVIIAVTRLTGIAGKVQAGEYQLAAGLSLLQLLEKLQNGEVKTYRVTFVEGWRLSELTALIAAENKISSQDRVLESAWFKREMEKKSYTSLEGLFFPDTYQFTAGMSASTLYKHAYQRMQKILQQEWRNRAENLPYNSPYEALIMASLIEKETGVAFEREQIAGVFVRRLHKKMRLQTDPTVIYGLGDTFDGNLRSRHLKDKSNLFNTYKHHGLPPTPIALAGREAIYAALHPAAGESLYFVAKGDGSHYFSSTLKQHLRAVKQYQIKHRRSDYRSAPTQ